MDFDDLIVDLVRQGEPDLDSRLESQAEALKELECTNPVLGRWIDEYDVEYLIAAFNLDDDEFSSRFPAMGHLNQHDRSQIIEAFENHFDQCPHCFLKRGYDMEMNARIERAYDLNNAAVMEHLQSEEVTPVAEDQIPAAASDNVNDKQINASRERAYSVSDAVMKHLKSAQPMPTSRDEILTAAQELVRAAAVKRARK